MQVAQSQLNQNKDVATRAYQSHVKLSKRAQELIEHDPAVSVRVSVPELEARGLTPSVYTVLVSRIENGGADPVAVDELAGWLDQRLPSISEQARRRLVALPEYAAAGLPTDVATFPRKLAARLREGSQTPALLALLKHPVFAGIMKDQQAPVGLYGPRGVLRAS
jgi:hypothetical protein